MNDELRLSELMGAMSLATDLAMGHPLESGLAVAVVATRFAEEAGFGEDQASSVFYLSLLRHIGCTAENHEEAARVGNEVAMREYGRILDLSSPREKVPWMFRHIRRTFPPSSRPAALIRMVGMMRGLEEHAVAVCEVADMLAGRLGFDDEFRAQLVTVSERWDGKGYPGRCSREEVPPSARVVQIVETALGHHEIGGEDAAVDVVRRRAGSAFDPALSKLFCDRSSLILSPLGHASLWDTGMDAERGKRPTVEGAALERALHAMADFTSLKSPYLVDHSSGVARLAESAGSRVGLPQTDIVALRRAALVHDVGRVAVTASIWGKQGALTRDEWEKVRLHPYNTDRVLSRPGYLAGLGAIASMHHERLDGTGYFRAAPAAHQSAAARILAAADVFHAMTEPRPHRPALPLDRAAEEIKREVREGRLDPDAVAAVLEAAGQRPPKRRSGVAGLTSREVEVLRLLARGLSIREIATALTIAPKTADAHIQHIYTKAGVSTRAAATLFAMQNDLLAVSADDPVPAPER